MKSLIILVLVVATALAAEKYTTEYDNINIDEILSNKRLLMNYINCMLDVGRCNADGNRLKSTLPDALKTDCSKCGEKQKVVAEKVINFLKANRPDDWSRLVAKYDPEGLYQKRFDAGLLKKH